MVNWICIGQKLNKKILIPLPHVSGGGVKTQKYKMATNLSFQRIATVPDTGLTVGRIYFETSTGLIKVATSTSAYNAFGGVRNAQWNSASQHLIITNANGSTIDLDLSDVASATEVSTAIAGKADKTYVDDKLAKKVDKVTGKGLSTNDYTTAEKTKLSGIAANAQVNVIESVKVNGAALEVTDKAVNVVVPAAAITGVKSGDKVLALANKELSTTLGLTYDSATKKINLTGIGSAVIASVDATDFIKDGMVKGVSFDPKTKNLTITFNTESGKEDIEVDLSDLVDTYTAGTGITITGNSIAVNTSTIATVASVNEVKAKAETAVQTVSASGTAPLTLSTSNTGTDVTVSGSVAEMKAATASAAGSAGIVPAPAAGKQASFLRGDGTWAVPTNTNTTYTFANGTAGNFTVTPSGGTAQTVSVGKPATAGTADKVGHALTLTVAGGSTEGTSKYTFDGSAGKALNIVAGSNVTLTPAAGQLTIAATDMKYTHPAGSAASKTSGFYKFSTDSTSHIASVTTVAKADITSLIGSNTYDAYGAASTAETNAKEYADSLLAWSEFE